MCGIKNTETPTSSPMDLAILTPMRVGPTSKYRGWVYGYGLHLTTTASGFPRLAKVYTASVSERAVLDQQMDPLLARNIRYIVADAGYTDLNRVKKLAGQGVLLLTPVNRAKSDTALGYLQAIETSELLNHYYKQRKTAIEPVFGVLLETGSNRFKSEATTGQSA